MLLYHATNSFSAKRMLVCGMGLDLVDYRKLAILIANYFKIEPVWLDRLIVEIANDGEAHGQVSFMQSKESCIRLRHYGGFGGEWRGTFVNRALKIIARKKKIPYKTIKDNAYLFDGRNTPPVIVVVDIPETFIVNIDAIGSNSEVFTKGKIEPVYIKSIEGII